MSKSSSRIADIRRMEALVLHPKNGMYFENRAFDADEFAVTLWPGTLLVFRRMLVSSECFEAKEVRSSSSRGQHLPVLAGGVLWSRWAAFEAEKSISAYREAVNRSS